MCVYQNVAELTHFKKALEQQNLRSQKLQDEVNQDINELSQETDSLVEEIDKWQT